MRISELAEGTGVPVATLKYYLREGLLHPGTATSRTQATYDSTHVERVRLIRALSDVAGLSLTTIGRVLNGLEDPSTDRLGLLRTAQQTLGPEPCPSDDTPPSPATEWLSAQTWRFEPTSGPAGQLDRAWQACLDAGIDLTPDQLTAYADAMLRVAQADLDAVPDDPQEALRYVVLGTVLIDQVLIALRRLAQQHVSINRNPS